MHTKTLFIILFALVGPGFLISSCSIPETSQEISETNIPTVADESPSFADPSHEPEKRLPDDEATSLMYSLSSDAESLKAVDTILAAKDPRFIPVFIELMRANQIGLVQGAGYLAHIEALEMLSSQSFGDDWPAWIEWYGTTDLVPPPGFTGWKGAILGGIDSGFEDFLQDEYPSVIRVEEIQWGGVRVDGIPALDNAAMISPNEASYLEPDEPVFGISINGDHRAYPLRILDWHEMANDVVGGVPVSLAYCTLCGAGIAFDGRAANGEIYTFGSSGFLYRSNKLMYDRQTRTLWNQLTGEPVLGELVGEDLKLKFLPVVTSWKSWLAQHPETLVLDVNTGYQRPYEPGEPYGTYFADTETMFPVWQRSNLLETKDRVYALHIEGIPTAYPLDILIEELVVNDTVGETNIVLVAARGDITVQSDPAITYNAGGEVRAYHRGEESFKPGPDADTVVDTTGRTWQVTEEALVGPAGELSPRINGHLAYWFGWYSFFPKTVLYGEE
jgi:hypothetical protein